MSLKSFFRENNIKIEETTYLASDRFKDENGELIYWKLKVLTNKELDDLKISCTKTKFVKHQPVNEFDSEKFAHKMITDCILYPNLYDKELQDSYGVFDPYKLLCEILTSGEMIALQEKIDELHSYNGNKVDDIKK